MGNTRILRHEQVLELQTTVITVGLTKHRNALLAGIDAAFVASLSDNGAPSALILMDLDAMNTAGALSDGCVPLLRWLQNAVALTGGRQEAAIFSQALTQVQERTGGAPIPVIKTPTQPPDASGFLSQESNGVQQGVDAPIDVAILTAIEVERRAVCAAFGLTDQDRIKRKGRVYWRGKLPIGDGTAYDLVVAQPAAMGQTEATALATEVAHVWRPRMALMVGIAASTKPGEVKLGDVVVGRDVYYYEHGKITAEGIQPQPEMIPADANLLKRQAGLAGWDGAVLASRPDGTVTAPRVFLGVIASGDKVVAHAAARDAIAGGQRKILALEMEGYGFSRALWLHHDRIPYLVIRGISDDGSEHKRDDWHHYAAASAAGFARHFLLDRPREHDGSSAPAPSNGSSAKGGDFAIRAQEAEPLNAGTGAGAQSGHSEANQRVPSSTEGPSVSQAQQTPAHAQEEHPTPSASTSPPPAAAPARDGAKPPEVKSRVGQTSSLWTLVAVIAGFLYFRDLSSSDASSSQEKPLAEVGSQPVPKPPSDRQPKQAPKPISNKPAPSPQPSSREKAPATIHDLRQEHGVTPLPETVKPVPVDQVPRGMLGYMDPSALPSLRRAMVGRNPTGRSFELHKATDGAVFLIGYVRRETLEGIQRGQPIDEALLVPSPTGQRAIPVSIPIERIQKAYFAIAPDSVEVLALKLGPTPVP